MMLSSSSSSSSGPDLSNIPLDTLREILKRLQEVPDFIRSRSVCKSWRNLPYPNKTQIPWLMFSSGDKIDYFYSLSEAKKYAIRLPDIVGRRWIGSSQGFLIFLDNIADLHAVNPITGTHLSLPPTSNSPGVTGVLTDPETGQITHYVQRKQPGTRLGVDYYHTPVSRRRDCHYGKVVLSPSADTAVVICQHGQLEYARVGDDEWTDLGRHDPEDCFSDATFHKGRLYAVTDEGTMDIFDELAGGKSAFVSLEGPLSSEGCPARYLVESPDREDLFLVYKEVKTEYVFLVCKDVKKKVPRSTVDLRVFLWDEATYTWNRMTSLGDVALFLGINHSMSLCTREHPGLERNSIYFTGNESTYPDIPGLSFACDMEVFNLEDGSIDPIFVDSILGRPDRSPPIWFMPTLS